ncbi:hypothetical protein [Streptomyces hydrogenans]
MTTFGRLTPDDGRHLPLLVIVEDASTAAGAARHRAGRSRGHSSHRTHATREETLTEHLTHVATRIESAAGPPWLRLGPRLAVLVTGMLLLWGGAFAAGQFLAQDLADTAAAAVRAGSALAGLAATGCLMVDVRRYIAPTRH